MLEASVVALLLLGACAETTDAPPLGWNTTVMVLDGDGLPVGEASVEFYFVTFPPEVDLDSSGVVRRLCGTTDATGGVSVELSTEAGAVYYAPTLAIRAAGYYCGLHTQGAERLPVSCAFDPSDPPDDRRDSRTCRLDLCTEPCQPTLALDCRCEPDPVPVCEPSDRFFGEYDACRDTF